MLLYLEHQVHGLAAVALGHLDLERVVDLRQLAGEDDVDHDAQHLLDPSDVSYVSVLVSHSSPSV